MATGSVLLGGAAINRFAVQKEASETNPIPPAIQKINEGTKKNVLVLMSSGTRRGNTDQLTDAYIKGLTEKGHIVNKVYLGSMRLEGCRGCGACQRNGNRCVIQDGMQDIYPLFAVCDTMVMASPLYFWTITARLKSFIERLYAISLEDKYPVKDLVLLMTSGDDKENTFKQPLEYYRILNNVFGGKAKGTYFAGDCTGCEKTGRKIDQKHLDNTYRMGLEL